MQSLSCKSSLSLCFSALGIWLTRSKIQGKKSNDDAEEERGMMLRGGLKRMLQCYIIIEEAFK